MEFQSSPGRDVIRPDGVECLGGIISPKSAPEIALPDIGAVPFPWDIADQNVEVEGKVISDDGAKIIRKRPKRTARRANEKSAPSVTLFPFASAESTELTVKALRAWSERKCPIETLKSVDNLFKATIMGL